MTVVNRASAELTRGDGVRISAEYVSPSKPEAVVVFCHGVCEHRGRYQRLIEQFCHENLACISFDFRGHGTSSGKRGHVDRFEDYLDDLHQVTGFRDSLVDRFDLRLNSFLLGHSLGGVIVTRYLQEQGKNAGYSGFILSSPGFVSAVPIPNYKRVLAVGLTFIYPTLRLATGISANALMTDEAERLAYTTDPKVTSKVSLRWFTEFEQSGRIALDRAGEIALPHYVLYGSDDRVVCTAAIERFFEVVGAKDKTIRCWQGLRHEPLNESFEVRTQVVTELLTWIRERV